MLESDKRDSEGLIPGAVGQNIVLEIVMDMSYYEKRKRTNVRLRRGDQQTARTSGAIVGLLYHTSDQRMAVTCEGDFPFPFQAIG